MCKQTLSRIASSKKSATMGAMYRFPLCFIPSSQFPPSFPPFIHPSFPLSFTQQYQTSQQDYIKVELKILTAFVCFTFVMLIGITNITLVLGSYREMVLEILDYFVCESTGVSPGTTCSRSGFENADYTSFTLTINEFIVTLYVLVLLIFVVNVTEIKEVLRNMLNRTNSHATFCRRASNQLEKDLQRRTALSLVDAQTNGYPTSLEDGSDGRVSIEVQRSKSTAVWKAV